MSETELFTIPVRVLIFFMKLRHRRTLQEIATLYDYDNTTEIQAQFNETLVIYFAHSNELPRMFTDPNLTDEMKDELFEEIMDDVPFMYKQLAENIADPLGENRYNHDVQAMMPPL